MPKSPSNLLPETKKSGVFGGRQLCARVTDQRDNPWLPDVSLAGRVAERSLPPEDDFGLNDGLPPCPAAAPGAPSGGVPAAAVAQWTFDTYCALVRRRLVVYNKYRRQINEPGRSPATPGRYLRACRLAREQISCRELPTPPDFTPEALEAVLSLFERVIKCTLSEDDLVIKFAVSGTVEVRRGRPLVPYEAGSSHSSSSRSSSLGGDPGARVFEPGSSHSSSSSSSSLRPETREPARPPSSASSSSRSSLSSAKA